MPVPTRQPIPDTSATVVPLNESNPTKKRPGSEIAEERRDAKKLKVDGQPNANERDKKKKKKKKKKIPVVAQARDALTQQRPRSTSKSMPPSTSKHVASNGGVSGTEEVGAIEVGAVEVEDHCEVESSSRSPDKGKGKARERSTPRRSPPPEAAPPSHAGAPVASGSGSSHAASSEPFDQALEIVRLKEQLEEKSRLLDRHQAHLNHHHQALTCQICLDLLHKPYALNPCGHITCYGCLVRWFTAPQNPNEVGGANGPPPPDQGQGDDVEAILDSASARLGNYLRRRKTCPVCRAAVHDRPVEIWGIKSMVASLLRSGLVDAPAPAPPTPAMEGPANANTDPWRNVFRNGGARRHPAHQYAPFGMHPPPPPAAQDDGDREQLGWYDAEDGGIYRCIECYHEIWDGVCSGCHRAYPGHDRGDDDEDGDDFDDFDDDEDGPGLMADVARYFDQEDEEEDYDLDLEEPDHIWGVPFYDDDDDDDDDEDDGDLNPRYHYHPFGAVHAQPIELADDEEDEFDMHAGDVRNWFRNNPDAHPNRRNNGIARIEEVHDDAEEEDEEDSQYGGSFIDDEAAEDDLNRHLDDDGDDEDIVVEQVVIHDQPPGRRPAPARRRNAVIEISDDDDDEGGEDMLPRRPLRLAHRPHVIQDDDDEDIEGDSEEDGESLRSVSPIPMRAARARTRWLPSDDEDEED